KKCLDLRIFEDDGGKMNLSLLDVEGDVMVVSQFTLYGDCRKGRRPDFTRSATSARANGLYREFIDILEGIYPRVSEGVFGAHMMIDMVNDGPVTLVIDRE
ncbi:MAG TPA: D-aminoacyl-tRNA deacylase, partial [Candidatus Krumholzibacterium sp.]|nr:D-aminoacyl-tRNA deacylase [Candidatus Krumholzibacterium sp.]